METGKQTTQRMT